MAAALASLVERAGGLELEDPAWEEVRSDAARITGGLARAGMLDRALVVSTGDAPVVVARLLARLQHDLCPQCRSRAIEPERR